MRITSSRSQEKLASQSYDELSAIHADKTASHDQTGIVGEVKETILEEVAMIPGNYFKD